MKTQEQRLDFLLRYLKAENREYENLTVPDSIAEQKRLFRALVNVRPPLPRAYARTGFSNKTIRRKASSKTQSIFLRFKGFSSQHIFILLNAMRLNVATFSA